MSRSVKECQRVPRSVKECQGQRIARYGGNGYLDNLVAPNLKTTGTQYICISTNRSGSLEACLGAQAVHTTARGICTWLFMCPLQSPLEHATPGHCNNCGDYNHPVEQADHAEDALNGRELKHRGEVNQKGAADTTLRKNVGYLCVCGP